MTDFISQDFEQKNVAAETFDRDLYNKLYRLKLPCVFQLKQPIPANIIEALKENNIQTFLVAENKYAFCHANDEKLINRLSNKYKDMTPRGELLSSHSELEMSETDQDYKYLEDIENNANLELQESNEKSGNWLQRAWKRTKSITASASQIVPGFKYVRKKMKKLENTGFYKYDEGVIVPLANNGKWGISVVDDLLDFETQLPLTIDLSNEAMSQDPKVFLIRQLVLKKAGMPYSRQAISLIRNLTHLEKQEVKLNSETITDLSQIDINTPIIIDGLTVNPNERITSLASRINYDLSDRFSIRTWMDPLLGGTASILWIFAKVTRIPQLQLAEAVRSGVEAGFDIKNEISKMDPEIIKELGWITFAALASKYFVADRSSNIGVKLGLGTLIGIGSAALVNIQAERIAKQKIELARSNGKNMSQRDAEELIAKYKEQAEQLVRFFSSMSAFVSATTSVEMQQLRMANSITDEQIDNAHINRSVPLDNHLHSNKGLDPFMGKDFNHDIEDELRTKNIPVKGAIFNEIDEARNKDLNVKGGNLNQENELLNNNVGGKPVLDGDANTPNRNAGNQVLEDAKNSAGRTMERILPGATTTQLIDENAANAWANEWGNPVADRVQLVNAIQDIENYFRAPGAGFDPTGAERAIHEILGHGNTTADITAEDIARIGAILSNARTSGFAGIDINAMLNVNHPDHGIAVAAAQRAIAARPDIFQNNPITHGFAYPGVLRFIGTPSIGATPALGGLLPPGGPGIVIGPVDFGAGPSDFLFNQLGVSREVAAGVGIITTGILGFLALRRRNNAGNQQYAQNNALGNGANAPLAYPPINVQRPGNPQNPNYAINNLFVQPFVLTPAQFQQLNPNIQHILRHGYIRWPAQALNWQANPQLRRNLQTWTNNFILNLANNRNQNDPILVPLFDLRRLLNARRPNPQAINVAIDDVLRQYFLAYPPAGVNPVPPQAQVVQMQPQGNVPFRQERVFGMVNNNFAITPDQFRALINNFARLGNQQNWDRRNQGNLRDLVQAMRANFRNQNYLMGLINGLEPLLNHRRPNVDRINHILDDIGNAYQDIYANRPQANQQNNPIPNGGDAPAGGNQADVRPDNAPQNRAGPNRQVQRAQQDDRPDDFPDFDFEDEEDLDFNFYDNDQVGVPVVDPIPQVDPQQRLQVDQARADANQQQRAQVAQRQGQPRVADPIRVQPQQVVQPVPDPAPLPVRPAVVSQDQGLQNMQLDPDYLEDLSIAGLQIQQMPDNPNINEIKNLHEAVEAIHQFLRFLNNTSSNIDQNGLNNLVNKYRKEWVYLIMHHRQLGLTAALNPVVEQLFPILMNIDEDTWNNTYDFNLFINNRENIDLNKLRDGLRLLRINILLEIGSLSDDGANRSNVIQNNKEVANQLRDRLHYLQSLLNLDAIPVEYKNQIDLLIGSINKIIQDIEQNQIDYNINVELQRIEADYNKIREDLKTLITTQDQFSDILPFPDNGPSLPPAPPATGASANVINPQSNLGTTDQDLTAQDRAMDFLTNQRFIDEIQAARETLERVTQANRETYDILLNAYMQAQNDRVKEIQNLFDLLQERLEKADARVDKIEQQRAEAIANERKAVQKEREARDREAQTVETANKQVIDALGGVISAQDRANQADLKAQKAETKSQIAEMERDQAKADLAAAMAAQNNADETIKRLEKLIKEFRLQVEANDMQATNQLIKDLYELMKPLSESVGRDNVIINDIKEAKRALETSEAKGTSLEPDTNKNGKAKKLIRITGALLAAAIIAKAHTKKRES